MTQLRTRSLLCALVGMVLLAPTASTAQSSAIEEFVPVTDEMLRNPDDGDWLMWRRTRNGWGYSPVDQVYRDNVGRLRLVWTRALAGGRQEGTPLVVRTADIRLKLETRNINDVT